MAIRNLKPVRLTLPRWHSLAHFIELEGETQLEHEACGALAAFIWQAIPQIRRRIEDEVSLECNLNDIPVHIPFPCELESFVKDAREKWQGCQDPMDQIDGIAFNIMQEIGALGEPLDTDDPAQMHPNAGSPCRHAKL